MENDKEQSKSYFKVIPAVYLFLRRGDEVLLLRRANTGYQDGKYSVIAGHLNGGELATQALVREAKEEAGIDVSPSSLQFVHAAHRLNDGRESERVDFFFESREWQGEVKNTEPEKSDDLRWFSVKELPPNMLPFIRIVLEHVFNNTSYSEYSEEPN